MCFSCIVNTYKSEKPSSHLNHQRRFTQASSSWRSSQVLFCVIASRWSATKAADWRQNIQCILTLQAVTNGAKSPSLTVCVEWELGAKYFCKFPQVRTNYEIREYTKGSCWHNNSDCHLVSSNTRSYEEPYQCQCVIIHHTFKAECCTLKLQSILSPVFLSFQ